MSGFKDDVLAILRDNVLLHGEAMGYVPVSEDTLYSQELLAELESRNLPVTGKSIKDVLRFDYIVIDRKLTTVPMLITALSLLSKDGVLIIDASYFNPKHVKEYRSVAAGLTVTPVRYDKRVYLVIHTGADYGN